MKYKERIRIPQTRSQMLDRGIMLLNLSSIYCKRYGDSR